MQEKTDKNSKSKKKEDDTKKSIKSNDSKAKQKAKRSENQDSEEEEEEENNDEEDILQGPHVRLLFSVHNAREAHMVGGVSEVNLYICIILSFLSVSKKCVSPYTSKTERRVANVRTDSESARFN